MANWPDKDPSENLDYTIDWSAALVANDTIVSSEWFIPTGLNASQQTHDITKTIIWLSGGTVGEKYTVGNRITTTDGRIMERSVLLKIKNR